jgi:hypothetical protein
VTTRKRIIAGGVVVAGSLLVALLVVEVTLRLWPTLLGWEFANGALTRYTTRPGGIYYFDRHLRINFMIPNHTATMFYNGYVWRHETDALGFRNKPLHVPADVMLLGDSLVYGHGVDYEHTVGYELEQRTGLRVANLGRQGDCAFQEAYLLTAYLPVFKSRAVVYVFTPNDIEDLYAYMSNAAMDAFIAQPLDRVTYPAPEDPRRAVQERERRIRSGSLPERLYEGSYVGKLVRWLRLKYRHWRVAGIAVAEAAPLDFDAADVSTNPASRGWRYTAHAIAYMKYLTDHAGARLLMVPVTRDRQLEILRGIAGERGIEVVETDRLFAEPSSFLPKDGHFSPHGAAIVAELIAERLMASPPKPATHTSPEHSASGSGGDR